MAASSAMGLEPLPSVVGVDGIDLEGRRAVKDLVVVDREDRGKVLDARRTYAQGGRAAHAWSREDEGENLC